MEVTAKGGWKERKNEKSKSVREACIYRQEGQAESELFTVE